MGETLAREILRTPRPEQGEQGESPSAKMRRFVTLFLVDSVETSFSPDISQLGKKVSEVPGVNRYG